MSRPTGRLYWGQSVTSPGVGARARFMSRLVRPSTLPLWFGFVVAVCFIAAETLLLYPLKRVAPVGGLAVVYLVGIVAIAIVWGWWLAALTSVASALTFDFFHTPPLYSVSLFTLHRADDWVAMVAFLTMALVASALTDLARWRAAEADQRRREAEASRDQLSVLATQQAALRRVATLVARGASPPEVFAAVAEEMARCLQVGSAEVFQYQTEAAQIVVVASYAGPEVEGLRIGERLPLEGDKVASTVFRSGHTARIDSFESATGARVGAPIVVDERIWGLAVVGSSHTEPLSADTEERIAEFADLVATAIAAATTRAELIASRARIVAAADNARRRLERDLHDGAQQRLVGLGLKARAAQAHALPEQTLLTQELSERCGGIGQRVQGAARNLARDSSGHPLHRRIGPSP